MPQPEPLLIVGSYLSPYVRKVRVCLEIKGIAKRPITSPFFGDDRFSGSSPLRRTCAGRRRPGAERSSG
jgi:glutathione S-transferase